MLCSIVLRKRDSLADIRSQNFYGYKQSCGSGRIRMRSGYKKKLDPDPVWTQDSRFKIYIYICYAFFDLISQIFYKVLISLYIERKGSWWIRIRYFLDSRMRCFSRGSDQGPLHLDPQPLFWDPLNCYWGSAEPDPYRKE